MSRTPDAPHPAAESHSSRNARRAKPAGASEQDLGLSERNEVVGADSTPAKRTPRESEETFRNMVESANDGIGVIQDGVIKFANPRLAEMAGRSRADMVGRPFLDFLHPDEVSRVKGVHEARMAGQDVPSMHEMQLQRKPGDYLYAEVNSILVSYHGRPAALFILRDATVHKRAERLKESIFRISAAAVSSDNLEDLVRSIHKVISDFMPAQNFYIALYDAATNLLSFPYFVDEYDSPPEPKPVGRGLTEYVLRTGRPLLASPEVFVELERQGEVESIGAPSIDWLGVPLSSNGSTIGVLVVQTYTEGVRYGEEEKELLQFFSDQVALAVHRQRIEDRVKVSLQEKDVLIKEVHHRVKNNMQVISSLLNLQSRRIQDPDILEMFRESQRRIRSMALIHERLYQSSDLSRIEFSQYLRNLATHLFHSCEVSSDRVRLRLDTEEVFLNINTAIPCGLIVNELISNALKHAFPEGRTGEVMVELHRASGDGYALRVSDDGVGIPRGFDFRRTGSLGMQIVNTLVNQLDGEIELAQGEGTDFTISFQEVKERPRS